MRNFEQKGRNRRLPGPHVYFTLAGPRCPCKRLDIAPAMGYQSDMKKLILSLLIVIAASAFAADSAVKGYLVDIACASEEGQTPGFGAKHSKGCLQMPDCEKSGYAVLTEDKKVIRFNKDGNDQAKKFIAALTKKTDIRVVVTGTTSGDQIAVSKIELQ